MIKESAFTLAEIIITLTIVGVIAAMTIPDMITNIQDQQYRTAWKKTFADFNQASKRLATDYNENLSGIFGNSGDHDKFRNMFLPYLNYTRLCNKYVPTGPDGCWHNSTSWYNLSGSVTNENWEWTSRMILSNGTLVSFENDSETCTNGNSPNRDTCGLIRVDVNGFKGPNKIGKDIFGFMVLKNGRILPKGSDKDGFYVSPSTNSCDVKTYTGTEGWNCSADYLYQ